MTLVSCSTSTSTPWPAQSVTQFTVLGIRADRANPVPGYIMQKVAPPLSLHNAAPPAGLHFVYYFWIPP